MQLCVSEYYDRLIQRKADGFALPLNGLLCALPLAEIRFWQTITFWHDTGSSSLRTLPLNVPGSSPLSLSCCVWQSERAVSQSSWHLQRRHHPHPCSLVSADVWPKPGTLRFIQPNCSNAPLHILSNGNGVATMGKVII